MVIIVFPCAYLPLYHEKFRICIISFQPMQMRLLRSHTKIKFSQRVQISRKTMKLFQLHIIKGSVIPLQSRDEIRSFTIFIHPTNFEYDSGAIISNNLLFSLTFLLKQNAPTIHLKRTPLITDKLIVT